jgi:hypothetical protein
MRRSLHKQTYTNWKHHVSVQGKCNYTTGIPVKLDRKAGNFPANLHMNVLTAQVRCGWIMCMDDDDYFLSPQALEHIVSHIESEDQLIMWGCSDDFRVNHRLETRNGEWVFPNITPRKKAPKNMRIFPDKKWRWISSYCYLYHSKHKHMVEWVARCGGDAKVYRQLKKGGLKKKVLDAVLTGRQWRGCGRRFEPRRGR